MLLNLKSRGNEKLAYILLNEYNNKIKDINYNKVELLIKYYKNLLIILSSSTL